MDRLTYRGNDGNKAYCDYGIRDIISRLAEYEDLEESGKLLRLPCKIGDKVYRQWSCGKNGKDFVEFTVTDIDIKNYPDIVFKISRGSSGSPEKRFSSKDIGTTVFLNKSELGKRMSLEEELVAKENDIEFEH